MSLTVKQVGRIRAQGRGHALNQILREQLQIIDGELRRADTTWGRNLITHDLPTDLAVPGLSKKDVQRTLYSVVISSLERRGFEVGIVLDAKRTTLYIAWMASLDPEDVKAMDRVISGHILHKAEVEEFAARSRRPRGAPGIRAGGPRGPGGGKAPADAPAPTADEAELLGT